MKCAACLLCVFGLVVQSGDSFKRVILKLLCAAPGKPLNEDLTPELLQKSLAAAAIALRCKQEERRDVTALKDERCSDWISAWEEF